jgi:UDP-2-acetamido-3-amino-2,3-dideoxy-glucuronate N-acetyltransferase
MDRNQCFIHSTAEVSPEAIVGPECRIWHQAQIRERARIGKNCIIGKGVYVDFGVVIGNNVKLQNGVQIFHGAVIEDGVFLGPGVVLANDRLPRAINPDGTLKTDADWEVSPVRIRKGASVGTHVVVLPGVTVGEFAMIGAGAVVTRDVPSFGLAYGNPATLRGYVCRCGQPLIDSGQNQWRCRVCNENYTF